MNEMHTSDTKTVSDADYQEPGCVAFLDDDPVKIQESEVLVDFLDRYTP